MNTKRYASLAKDYAKDVVAGKVLTSKWVRLACQRQIKDLIRLKGKESTPTAIASIKAG